MCYNEGMDGEHLTSGKPAAVTLTREQAEASGLITAWFFDPAQRYFVLCGYAGTGKTFLVDRIVGQLGLKKGNEVAFVAPTGKAASVLERMGNPASTVHSLIYLRDEELVTDENGEVLGVRFVGFQRRDKLPSSLKLIVVDETSMVSDEMVQDLLSYGVKCLFLGDPAQLPPVNGFNRLLSFAAYTLTEIVRQQPDSPIAQLAAIVRGGGKVPLGQFGACVYVITMRQFSERVRKKAYTEADIIIVGTNRTRARINREVRELLGIPREALLPVDGEKLICTLNDWTHPLSKEGDFRLVNGTVGRCYHVREREDALGLLDFHADFLPEGERACDLPFDTALFTEGQYAHDYGARAYTLEGGRVVAEPKRGERVRREEPVCRFEFGYAVTCHKAQGSEYDYVVVIDESGCFGEDRAAWLYTAISRARKKLLIVRPSPFRRFGQ